MRSIKEFIEKLENLNEKNNGLFGYKCPLKDCGLIPLLKFDGKKYYFLCDNGHKFSLNDNIIYEIKCVNCNENSHKNLVYCSFCKSILCDKCFDKVHDKNINNHTKLMCC